MPLVTFIKFEACLVNVPMMTSSVHEYDLWMQHLLLQGSVFCAALSTYDRNSLNNFDEQLTSLYGRSSQALFLNCGGLNCLTFISLQADLWIAGRLKLGVVNSYAEHLATSICSKSPIDSWELLKELEAEHYLDVHHQAVGFWTEQTTRHSHVLPIPAQNLQQTESHLEVSHSVFSREAARHSRALTSPSWPMATIMLSVLI